MGGLRSKCSDLKTRPLAHQDLTGRDPPKQADQKAGLTRLQSQPRLEEPRLQWFLTLDSDAEKGRDPFCSALKLAAVLDFSSGQDQAVSAPICLHHQ